MAIPSFDENVITRENKEMFELTITSDAVISTDITFTMDRISDGDKFKAVDASFVSADGMVVKRNYKKYEKRNVGQTLPKIAFQVFEKQIINLSADEKENFPICRYVPGGELYCGIFSSLGEYRKNRKYSKTIEYLVYEYDGNKQFVIYCWNVFSTILFVQECLKRFGAPGDAFKLIYCEKTEKEKGEKGSAAEAADNKTGAWGYLNEFSQILIDSKNIIFRGAPGTGKTHLAKEIAADIVSNGQVANYFELTPEQKKQVEFVQFHPSYDYSDFVEGLRPKLNSDGSMGFELKAGIFKQFADDARKNYENSQKSQAEIAKELSVQAAMEEFFSGIEFGSDVFETVNGNKFTVTNVTDSHIYISIPENATSKNLALPISEIRMMLESEKEFKKVKDITSFLGKTYATQGYSYDFVIYNEILKKKRNSGRVPKKQELKKYVFIIDEINRGEISKILGELFFAIDPGYRGKAGEVSTQYANMHSEPEEKFYIPENVYIIGTMNDIDRSVDSFDFALRRRFRFIEIKADSRLEMLDGLEDDALKAEAIGRMKALNAEIAECLNENYQIGAAYFLKLKTLGFDRLWTDFLRPLLREYTVGMYDETGIMDKFEKAYGYKVEAES